VSATLARLRPLRTELIAIGLIVALVLLAAVVVTLRLAAFGIPDACFDPSTVTALCVARQADFEAYSNFVGTWGGAVMYAALVIPPGAGIILGVAVVGKELDQRTAVLAWSLSPSRRRWLVERVLPLLVVVILLGLGSELLLQFMLGLHREGPVPLSFDYIPLFGFAPAAEGIAAFGIGLVVGAMLGRLLPSLLASAAFAIFAFVLITQVGDRLLNGESITVETMPFVDLSARGKYLDSLVRTADGRIITSDQTYPDYVDLTTGQLLPGNVEIARIAPIEIYPEVAARFLVFLLLVAGTTVTLGFAVTDRRTP
jgi:hypothetical protein